MVQSAGSQSTGCILNFLLLLRVVPSQQQTLRWRQGYFRKGHADDCCHRLCPPARYVRSSEYGSFGILHLKDVNLKNTVCDLTVHGL